MKIVAIVQARMGSTRLPGKVLANIGDRSVIELILLRLSKSRLINEICVATSNNKEDDSLADIVANFGVQVYRGSELNVLERYYEAAKNAC